MILSDWLPLLVLGLWLTLAVLVTLTDWRLNIAALLVHYLLVAGLLAHIAIWPVVLARLLAGGVVVSILLLTGRTVNLGHQAPTPPGQPRFRFPTSFPFRSVGLILVSVAAWYTSRQPGLALPGLPSALNLACYLLAALGLFMLGLTEEPLIAGLGLFILLSGFQLFYTAIEPSLAIAGMLAAVDFALALAVSYLAGHWRLAQKER